MIKQLDAGAESDARLAVQVMTHCNSIVRLVVFSGCARDPQYIKYQSARLSIVLELPSSVLGIVLQHSTIV